VFLADADAAGDADANAYHTNANRDTLSDGNSDRPSYSHRPSYSDADADRLPPFPSGVRNTNSNSARHGYTFAATNAKPDGDTVARGSSGIKYLDAVAG
jgi:hypothetical protein